MREDSHIAIADQIIINLVKPKFPKASKYKKALRDGSVYPNTQESKIPHHNARNKDIKELIEKTRKLRLENKTEEAIFTLGQALHYIQDRWTSLHGSQEKHDMYEKLITQSTILPLSADLSIYYPILSEGFLNVETLVFEEFKNYNGFRYDPSQAEIVIEKALQRKPSESSAFLDLNLAYRISYMVTRIVLQPIKNPTLEKMIKKLYSRYQMEISARDDEERSKLESIHQEYDVLQKEKGIQVFIPRIFSKQKFERALNSYNKREHLKDFFKQYQKEYDDMALPYRYWYFVDHPPEFSLNQEYIVELLDNQVISDTPEILLDNQVTPDITETPLEA
jgi:hypothetical protein